VSGSLPHGKYFCCHSLFEKCKLYINFCRCVGKILQESEAAMMKEREWLKL
jgi:hypothetical protein